MNLYLDRSAVLTGLLLFGLGAIVSFLVYGQTVVRADEPVSRVGFVDLEYCFKYSPAGQRADNSYQKYLESKQRQFDSEQKALQAANSRLDKIELDQKVRALQDRFTEMQRDLAVRQEKMLQEFSDLAQPVIRDIAIKEGYTMIVDNRTVFWADSANNLTDKVLSRLK